MEHVHQCENMKSAEAWIETEHDECSLTINRLATEQDLEENGYLEEVGQVVELVTINVLYCPYCGERLDQSSKEFVPSFHHHKLSKW